MLNLFWSGFFLLAFAFAVVNSCMGNTQVWETLVQAIFSTSKNAFEIALGLTGVLCFWLGLMRIAEKSGLTELLAKGLKPLFYRIMPDVPKDSPAFGSIVMNIAANVLGLDNAATPIGLKAMTQLQDVNKDKSKASNAQILFMVINSSAVTLIPITILMYRFQAGSTAPTAVFVPILIATSVSTLVGFLATALWQKINIFDRVILGYLLFAIGCLGLIVWGFCSIGVEQRARLSYLVSNAVLFGLVIMFIASGLVKRLNVYELFIEGAKDGFKTAVTIIPYLVAMLTAIGVFRASGGFEFICTGIANWLEAMQINSDFVAVLPTALMKPLSGSGARAMMIDTFNTYGVDSFAGFAASIVQGSTETTFYVLAVYFGAVKISKTGAALPLALIADVAGITAAIILAYAFY